MDDYCFDLDLGATVLYWAILEIGIGLSLAVNYSALVMGLLLFGYLLAGEHLSRQKMVSTVIGLIGLILVFVPTIDGTIAWLPMVAANGGCTD